MTEQFVSVPREAASSNQISIPSKSEIFCFTVDLENLLGKPSKIQFCTVSH
jgi:hypothetical protein